MTAVKKILKPNSATAPHDPQKYHHLLSRGGLVTPSTSMAKYVGKSFAIMDLVEDPIHQSAYRARPLAEKILEMNNKEKKDFVGDTCEKWGVKFTNRMVVNVFYNNRQKQSADNVRENGVVKFKQRQLKRRKEE